MGFVGSLIKSRLSFVAGVALSLHLCFETAMAGDAEKRAEALGAYVASTNLLEALSNSECEYLFKQKSDTLTALTSLAPHLSAEEKSELLAMMKSGDLTAKLSENRAIISGFLSVATKDGLDQKTACGVLVGFLAQTHAVAVKAVKTTFGVDVP